jgi:glycosyltransferase involved in cell wall biosynthesis
MVHMQTRANIFVATGIFHPESGGPATYLHDILPHFQQQYHWDVRLLTYGDSTSIGYPYPVTRIPRQMYPVRLATYGMASRNHLAWADLVYTHTIDLPLWGHRNAPRIIKIVGDQAWERCVRKAWVPADMNIDDFQSYEGNWQVRWQKQSRAKQVQAMDGVIVPSEYLKRMVMGWGVDADKIHVVYNALPTRPELGISQADARRELAWDDRPTLLTVARLHPWKGVDHLIAALHELPDVRLVVAGDGPDLVRLQSLAGAISERVTFLGQVPHEQIFKLMRAADGLALYSGYEGLSHTLLESLQVGTPVLASDKGGNPEVVQHGVNGVLVPYVDIQALRDGIQTLLDQRTTLAHRAHVGMERFEFSRMVAHTNETLRLFLT